jgi:hypothetical protein
VSTTVASSIKDRIYKVILPARSDFTTIGANAFDGFTNLDSGTLPAGITGIGANAFKDCIYLYNLTFTRTNPTASPALTIGADAFDGDTNFRYGAIYVPAGTVEAYRAALTGTGLDSRAIITDGIAIWLNDINVESAIESYIDSARGGYSYTPASGQPWVVAISDFNTSNSSYLTNLYTAVTVKFPGGKISLDLTACTPTTFASSSVAGTIKNRFVSVTLPHGVTALDSNALSGFDKLTSLTLPASVNVINGTIITSTSLTSITFKGATPPGSINGTAFTSATGIAEIHVPVGSSAYDAFPGQYGIPGTAVVIKDVNP